VLERCERACGGRGRALLVAAAIALGAVLRLDYAIRAPNHPVDDARAYARIAHSLYQGEGFSQGHAATQLHLQPASNYTPGLPLLVAGIYEVRGAVDQRAARIVLALLSALAIPLAFLLGRRLGGPTAGLIAAVPVAIYPAMLEYSGMLVTEPLGTTLLAAALLAFLRACEAPRAWLLASAGLLLGGLAMLRPEYLILFAVLPVIALLRLRGEASPRYGGLAAAALIGACACLVVLPWTIRNLLVLDRLVPLSTGGGQVLFEGSYIDAGPDPERVTPTILRQQPWIRRKLAPLPGPIYRGQVVAELAAVDHPGEDPDKALTRMGLHAYREALVNEPLRLGGFFAGKVWLAWTGASRSVMKDTIWRIFRIALMLAALTGLVVGLVRRSFDTLVIALTLLAVTLIQAVFIASPRRTLVLLPEISALAGLGLTWCAARLREALGQ
jgi:4-amino-4-deoxy-L-arabinose transferase-like glycosyltransferase